MRRVVRTQIVVCGAGTAGLPAALEAARSGCEVVLVEEDERIGGAPVDQGIQNFCGDPIQGVYKELKETMFGICPAGRNDNCFRGVTYLMAWNRLFKGLPITIYTGQKINRAIVEEGRITAVESESFRFEGQIFIDATGDAAVAAKTPCRCRYGRESRHEFGERFAPEKADNKVQLCTLMFTVRRKPGCPHNEDANWAILDNDEYLIWGPTVSCADTTDPVCLRSAQDEAMRMLDSQREVYDKRGFYITGVSPKLGVRESRRIEGEYMLSYNDVMSRKTYPDSICVIHAGIDPWDPEGNPRHSEDTVESTETPLFEVPYRCLVTSQIKNLIVTGRCISATHIVNSGLRIMGSVLIFGQAARNAAALAVLEDKDVLGVDVGRLREMQRQQGVRVSLDECR